MTTRLRVLVTEFCMLRGGETLFVRDLLAELARQGHSPALCAPLSERCAGDLRAMGIPVVSRLTDVPWIPDIIHGHQKTEVLRALRRFRSTPAVFVAHSHVFWQDRLGDHPRIRRYFGVSRVCLEPFREEGVPAEKIHLLLNFVDTHRFTPRAPLPARPCRALVFSNYASEQTYLPAVREACSRAGLELDVIGQGVQNFVAEPERVLGQYDVVFAKAKAAMEAMAVGTAVVLCDQAGVGPMVSSANFDGLRPMNFGQEALGEPVEPDALLRQIAKYDPHDAQRVRDRLRERAALAASVANLAGIYEQVIQEERVSAAASRLQPQAPTPRGRLWLGRTALLAYYRVFREPPSQLSGVPRLIYRAGRLLFRLMRV
jgi:glycosyltransferase involved in cell wall biosynthesis